MFKKIVKLFNFSANGLDMIWIGGNDLATNGKWVWTSRGRRIHPFVQWKKGSPSKSGHCLGIDVASYRWMDTNCERKAEFLCEQGMFFLSFVHFSIPLSSQISRWKMWNGKTKSVSTGMGTLT